MSPSPLPLLSLDPSSTRIGYALIGPGPYALKSGVEFIPKADPHQRVLLAGHAIPQIINHLPYRPASVLIEVPNFVTERTKDHIVWYFRAVGAVEMACSLIKLPIYYIPASAERAPGRKERNRQRFMQIMGRPPIEFDESDALVYGWDFVEAHQYGEDELDEPEGYPR